MNEEQQQEFVPLASEGEYVAPSTQIKAFHCPYCGVLAPQDWDSFWVSMNQGFEEYARRATCSNCSRVSYWINYEYVDGPGWTMVMPRGMGGQRPHAMMPDDVKADYEEARAIVQASPRGASALLRLATQKLLTHLGGKGDNINDDIAALVKKGLSVEIQQALDTLRVVGNHAVHPGELDLKDDLETANGLFTIINFIVQDRIAQPKALAALYNKLPESARKKIAKRDGNVAS